MLDLGGHETGRVCDTGGHLAGKPSFRPVEQNRLDAGLDGSSDGAGKRSMSSVGDGLEMVRYSPCGAAAPLTVFRYIGYCYILVALV